MTWLIVLAALIAVIFLLYLLALRCQKRRGDWDYFKRWRYAHRGYHDKPRIPENSLPAFRRAVQCGFGAELDVHLMKDGHLAVIHDASLRRTAGADVEIEDLTADSPTILMNAMFALAGIAWATINVNSFPMVVELASGGDVGKYTGFYYTASMAAQVATPMVSGLLMDKFGMHVLFPYAAVFTGLAFVTMLFVRHGDSREAPKQTAAAGTEDAGAIDNTVEELTND